MYPPKLLAACAAALLAIITPHAQAQTPPPPNTTEINRLLDRVKTADEFTYESTIDAIVKQGEAAIPALIKSLESDNSQLRRAAVQALQRIGTPATPALLDALKSPKPQVRWSAATALGGYYYREEKVIEALVKLFKDPDARVRRSAFASVANIALMSRSSSSSSLKAAVPDLITALKQDKDDDVRRSAAEALGRMGAEAKAAVPDLITALKDKDDGVRRSAAEALGDIGAEAKAAVPDLITALKDKDDGVRRSAAEALGDIGAEAKAAVPDLITALKQDKDDGVRRYAALTLERIGAEAKAAVPDLITALKDKDAQVRSSAASALERIGAEAKASVPDLITALKDKDAQVRGSAAGALANMGAEAKASVPDLITALKDKDAQVRSRAAGALVNMSAEAKAAVPDLITALKDKDADVRHYAAWALGNIGAEAKAAVPDLITALKDKDADVRHYAAYALGNIGAEAKAAVPELITALKQDKNDDVRGNAASALGRIGAEAKAAVPELITALKQDKNDDVRGNAASALGRIGAEAKAAVPDLITALKQDKNDDVRGNAASALGRIGAEAKAAVPDLITALKQDKNDWLRRSAASALGSMGAEAKAAVPELVTLLKDDEVRYSAASALARIALSLSEKAKDLSTEELSQVISHLEAGLKVLENSEKEFDKNDIATIRLSLDKLKQQQNALLLKLIRKYPWLLGVAAYLVFFPSLWGLLFWVRPLWLLKVNDSLKTFDFVLGGGSLWGGVPVSLRALLFVRFFCYQPRVLDAWVAAHIRTVRREFDKIETVKQRATYVPVAVEVEEERLTELSREKVAAIFQQQHICLLIWGEGGSGKTSIACQLAQWGMHPNPQQRLTPHLMIPILIEEELEGKITSEKDIFLAAIRGQLRTLTDGENPVTVELLQELLRRRRILVIVDHFSEMSNVTQQQIDPDAPDFPVNALMVTSRLDSTFGRIRKSTIHPLRIEGVELSGFMQKYLDKLGKLHLFNDPQFHYVCGDLAKLLEEIKNQGRTTTVLFAKLYADVLISKMEGNGTEDLPENIPDLMLSYLNELNRDVTENKLDERTVVHPDAKLVAWECLKPTFRPAPAERGQLENVLQQRHPDDAGIRLEYLISKLRILEVKGASKDKIRFALDPVAEYLAGLHLVDLYGRDDTQWQDFLTTADSFKALEAIKGFLLAVRDCYLAEIPGAKPTDLLPDEIAKRYNLPGQPAAKVPQPVTP
ncbi:HEAT repeat domain-containing protein [[Phormidium] sp. ETS-05]|uniref:HEAT repeat domain-containing protein n=1 Tax=[Phormidium] sp. ETS-05 TaxID=222819 RepID=UPI0018EF0099|nr:HEAT repeat domain-containing protein [[Phormidium] sp. ETS-05]